MQSPLHGFSTRIQGGPQPDAARFRAFSRIPSRLESNLPEQTP